MDSPYFKQIEQRPPLLWVYQLGLFTSTVTVVSTLPNGALVKWIIYSLPWIYNAIDGAAVRFKGQRLNTTVSHAYNCTLTGLLGYVGVHFSRVPLFSSLAAAHAVPVLLSLYDWVALRCHIPTIRSLWFHLCRPQRWTNIDPNYDDCPICLEQITRRAVQLECNHVYHRWCIKEWLSINSNCPTCRRNIV
jgi:hypothetical protein